MSTPPLNQLVVKIRAKYPGAYDDMDDAALTKAVLAKYPQYSDLAAPPVPKPPVPEGLQPTAMERMSPSPSLSSMGYTAPRPEDDPALAAKVVGRTAATGAAVAAPMLTGGASLPVQALVSGASGAAQSKLGGGSNTEAGISAGIGAAIPLGGAVVSRAWNLLKESGLDQDAIGMASPRLAHALRVWNKVSSALGEAPVSSPELDQAAVLREGAKSPTDLAAGLGKIPVRSDVLPATPMASETPSGTSSLSADIRPAHGESALRNILTGQDNANLLKIAKARGINVTKEALLKPGKADNLIINKIIDDFSPEELNDVGAQYLENMRFRHNFGDIGPEGWKTLSLQSYFPEMKIPAAQLKRTQLAIAKAIVNPQPVVGNEADDLTSILKQSLEAAKQGAH